MTTDAAANGRAITSIRGFDQRGVAGPESYEEAVLAFRAIFAQLAQTAGERDRTHTHAFDLVRQLTDAGIGRLRVPVEHGGYGVDLPTLFGLLAEAGQADSNVPQILRGHFSAVEILRHTPDDRVAGHWLRRIAAGAVFGNGQSEPAGANTSGAGFDISTHIHEVDGRAVVSGTKYYSTGSLYADHIRVAALDPDGNRAFVVVPARHPGVTHVDDWDGIGQRLTGSGTTHFHQVPVEPHGHLGLVQEALRPLPAFFQIVHLANLAGIARSIRDETIAVVRSRQRTGVHALSSVASTDPEVLGVIGRLQARSLTVDTLLRQVAEGLEAADAEGAPEAYERNYIEVSAAQVAVIEAVLDAATIAYDAGGSSTVREGVHLDRHWRNARTLASHNPVVYKPRVIGDYLVNGTSPTYSHERPGQARPAHSDSSSEPTNEGALP
ncbi:acyl-CoA dehydrogenase family protein [Nocardioides sp. NPDC059952]|uniref:acyl-CoA dehydrogenase family protein n=1 Tax=Nocardioides sp. NPDC059952 TaxID=3347014 RepID=UPI003652DDB9